MEREVRNNSGVLFTNDKKETEKHPNYKGSIRVDGVDYWISGWIKQSAAGKFMGLAVSPKETQPSKVPYGHGGTTKEGRDSEDFPF